MKIVYNLFKLTTLSAVSMGFYQKATALEALILTVTGILILSGLIVAQFLKGSNA